MLENREDPGTRGADPAGVEDEEEAEEHEGEESVSVETVWGSEGFLRPWRITTNVSKPKAAFTTSWEKEKNILKSSLHFSWKHTHLLGFKIR